MIIHIRNVCVSLLAITITYVVLNLFLYYDFVLKMGLLVLAIHIGDTFVKIVWNSFLSFTLKDLGEKTVLITGCDTGFGNMLARQLDAKGVTVFAGCLYAERADALKLKEECSSNLHVLQLDVTNDDQVKAAVEIVKEKLSGRKLWAVVNNAGIFSPTETVLTSIETYKKILDVNTLGTVRTTQAFLTMLKESKGRIVILSSFSGVMTFPMISAYSMSKHALLSVAESIRRETMQWSITVHAINPLAYNTGLANPKTIIEGLTKEWEKAPEELKSLYGPNYTTRFKKFHECVLKTPFKPMDDLQQVINCLKDAVIGKYPKLQYFPGLTAKGLLWLIYRTPLEVLDLGTTLVMYAMKKFSSKKQQSTT